MQVIFVERLESFKACALDSINRELTESYLKLSLKSLSYKVIMQGKLIAVVYTLMNPMSGCDNHLVFNYRPETVHCKKDAYTSEITFLAL